MTVDRQADEVSACPR